MTSDVRPDKQVISGRKNKGHGWAVFPPSGYSYDICNTFPVAVVTRVQLCKHDDIADQQAYCSEVIVIYKSAPLCMQRGTTTCLISLQTDHTIRPLSYKCQILFVGEVLLHRGQILWVTGEFGRGDGLLGWQDNFFCKLDRFHGYI